MLEKKNEIIILNDYYGELLTPKQKTYIKLYYEEDLSFGEIAENLGVSRNAVFRQIKNIEKIFKNYEEKLGLMKKGEKLKEIIEDLKKENISEKIIKKLKDLE
jgi:predicted DNA-binding protein YlxM (UPF0122 family)